MINGLMNLNHIPFTLVPKVERKDVSEQTTPKETTHKTLSSASSASHGVKVIINHYPVPSSITRTDSFDEAGYSKALSYSYLKKSICHQVASQAPSHTPSRPDQASEAPTNDPSMLDKAKEKVTESALRSSITKTASVVMEKLTGLNAPSKIVGSVVGSAVGNAMNAKPQDEATSTPVAGMEDYLLKYGSSGAISGLSSALLTPIMSASPLPAWTTHVVNQVTNLGVTQESTTNTLSAIAGAGVGAAANAIAANQGLIPQPPVTGEYGWVIEGAGNGFSMAVQLFVQAKVQQLTQRYRHQ